MKMTPLQFLPMPIIAAIFAFLLMVASSQFSFLPWVAFITWGAYFLTGINTKSAIREALGFTLGISVGAAVVLLTGQLMPYLGSYTLPVVVALAGFTIVLLELIPWIDMAPMWFFGAAVFFAVGATPDLPTMASVWIPGMIGLLIGVIIAQLRGMVLKAEGLPDPLKKE